MNLVAVSYEVSGRVKGIGAAASCGELPHPPEIKLTIRISIIVVKKQMSTFN
jgi:hypothetical protein